MLAAMIDGLSRRPVPASGAGASGVRRPRRPGGRRRGRRHQERRPTWPRCCRSWRCAGATSGCCCRCRARGSATPRSPRWPTTSRPSGSRASGPAMAITEPGCRLGLRRTIRTTATPRRRRLRHQRREDLRHRRRALRRRRGVGDAGQDARPRRDQVVRGAARARPGMTVERLEHKLGIRSSDTAAFRFENCRVPKENLLGDPDVDPKQGFAGAMATFDNTRPLVAAMAVGCARAVARADPRAARARPAS